LDNVAKHELEKDIKESDNEMDEEASEQLKKDLIELVGDIIGEAYLEIESRKSRVLALVGMFDQAEN
jgi:hypothetical protein